MKNNLKRIMVLMLAFLFTISVIPMNVLANEFNYSEIIAPKYQEARNFSEDLAAVKKNDKWGYIDVNDKTHIDFKYDMAYSFNEGRAVVGIEKFEKVEYYDEEQKVIYWGIIDSEDNYTPLTLANGQNFYTVLDSYYSDYEEDYLESFFIQRAQIFHNGMLLMPELDGPDRYAFDINGKQVFGDKYYTPSHAPNEGLVPVSAPGTDFANYADAKTGKILFENMDFADTRSFNQDVAPVAFWEEDTYDYYWTFLESDGRLWDIKFTNFYIQNIYKEYKIFNDNSLASIENPNGKWGAINRKGETVLDFKYDKLTTFSEGVAGFKENGKFGYIDIYGKEVIKPQFDDVSSFYNGLAVVRQGNKAYCIDKRGNKVEGTEVLPVSSYFIENGYNEDGTMQYTIISPGKYVLINKDSKYGFGQVLFTPSLPTNDEMSSWAFEEVIAAIENNLVPANLQNMYRTDITRIDFAALVVRAIEEVLGNDINMVVKEKTGQNLHQLVSKYPFKDTTNTNVVVAQALGIINGKSEDKFAPNDTISRQEAAALLMRTSKFLGGETSSNSTDFNDSDNIANYAKEAVAYVSGIGVMQGKENNKFAPNDKYSREQAYLTIYRLFNILIND